MISGVLTSRRQVGVFDLIVFKSRSLLVPWFCWLLLIVAIGKIHLLVGGRASLYGENGLSGALSTFWFVPVLFIVVVSNKLLGNVRLWLLTALSICLYGLVIANCDKLNFIGGGFVQKCIVAFFYFRIGNVVLVDFDVRKYLAMVGFFLAVFWLYSYPVDVVFIDMAANRFGGWFGLIIAISISALVIYVAKLIGHVTLGFMLRHLGCASLVVYYAHQAIHVTLVNLWLGMPVAIVFMVAIAGSYLVFRMITHVAVLRYLLLGQENLSR